MRKIVRMQASRPSSSRHGFSLVELSIVLAILGLLAGGIVTGRSLLRSSAVQSVGKEYSQYYGAIDNFRSRFKSLPGDMTNATDYWGADASCTNTPTNTVRKKETCNGNGDQNIGLITVAASFYETYRAWQHLSNAGLITDSYTGVAGSGGNQHSVPAQNVPGSRLKSGAWNIFPLLGAAAAEPTFYFPVATYKTGLIFGSANGTGTAAGTLLSGPEAYSIDKKFDDGRPGYGKVTTFIDAGPGYDCISTDTQSTADYILTSDQPRCALIFEAVSALN